MSDRNFVLFSLFLSFISLLSKFLFTDMHSLIIYCLIVTAVLTRLVNATVYLLVCASLASCMRMLRTLDDEGERAD
jgi:hypothetical protein